MRIKKSLAKLITWERVCHVATASASGVPHLVPVCHVLLDGKLYFASDADARKVRNLKANPRVAVTVDLYSDDWSNLKGVARPGHDEIRRQGATVPEAAQVALREVPTIPRRGGAPRSGGRDRRGHARARLLLGRRVAFKSEDRRAKAGDVMDARRDAPPREPERQAARRDPRRAEGEGERRAPQVDPGAALTASPAPSHLRNHIGTLES